MLIIRLQRVGRKNHAEFRMIVTEHTRGPKSANYLEMLGHYNPHNNEITLNAERIKHWISMGAQVSDTVNNLLVSEKVIKGKKINVLPKKTPQIKEVKDAPKEEKKEEKKEEVETVDKPKEEAVEEVKEEKTNDEVADTEAAADKKEEPKEA